MGEVIIRLSHVAKRFGRKIVLSDVNFELRRGETTAIVGAAELVAANDVRATSAADIVRLARYSLQVTGAEP
jgi:ABC-type uncharacterized transport system ATPase subunit